MAFALVGSVGVATTGSSGAALTPPWGTGENRTAGNLLACWSISQGGQVAPTPSGWTLLQQQGTSTNGASIYYRVATGGDAAPTLAATTGTTFIAQLAEFSGGATSSPLDKSNSGFSTSSPLTINTGSVDAAAGEMVLYASVCQYTMSAASTLTVSLNNGATGVTLLNNNGTSTTGHYVGGYALATTGNAAADAITTTSSTGTINTNAFAAMLGSFLLAPPPSSPTAPTVVRQAVQRAATR